MSVASIKQIKNDLHFDGSFIASSPESLGNKMLWKCSHCCVLGNATYLTTYINMVMTKCWMRWILARTPETISLLFMTLGYQLIRNTSSPSVLRWSEKSTFYANDFCWFKGYKKLNWSCLHAHSSCCSNTSIHGWDSELQSMSLFHYGCMPQSPQIQLWVNLATGGRLIWQDESITSCFSHELNDSQ